MSSATTVRDAGIPYCAFFMRLALREAALALQEREVPVGAVLVPLPFNAFASSYSTTATTSSSTLDRAHVSISSPPSSVEKEEGETEESALAALLDAYRAKQRAHDGEGKVTKRSACVLRGRNATNRQRHALAHAEFIAAESLLQVYKHNAETSVAGKQDEIADAPPCDLSQFVLYVTVEPCIMCAAFLRYNKISAVFYGIGNPRFGGNGSVLSIHTKDVPHAGKEEESSRPMCSAGAGHCSDHSVRGGGGATTADVVAGTDYPSEGGHFSAEAVRLLQSFYLGENPNAPGDKRKRTRQ